MKNFTQLIVETRKSISPSDEKELKKEISDFSNKMTGKIPEDASLASTLLCKYSIYDKDIVKRIASSSKSEINRIADEFSMDYKDAEQLQFVLKKMERSGDIRTIPVMMTKSEREDIVSGRKTFDDITMDLETEKGRTAIVREYKSLVMGIVGKYVGKSGLDRGELISAGLEGLTKAMNTYRRPGTEDTEDIGADDVEKKEGKKLKGLSFRQYAGWCIRNNILREIDTNSRTVRINSYQYQKMKDSGDISGSFISSLDNMSSNSDDDKGGATDRIPEIGIDPDVFKRDQSKDEERYKELYKIIEARFPMKKALIFYKIFGINGEKETSARTIGAELGLSEVRVSQIKQEIILYLRANPKAMEILGMLREMYTESLLVELFNLPKNQIYERLIGDDFYILLETLTKWDSKDRLSSAVSTALGEMDPSDADYIVMCLKEGFDFIDQSYRGRKGTILEFLNVVEPTEMFSRRSDAYIIDRLTELSNMCKKYKLYNK